MKVNESNMRDYKSIKILLLTDVGKTKVSQCARVKCRYCCILEISGIIKHLNLQVGVLSVASIFHRRRSQRCLQICHYYKHALDELVLYYLQIQFINKTDFR